MAGGLENRVNALTEVNMVTATAIVRKDRWIILNELSDISLVGIKILAATRHCI